MKALWIAAAAVFALGLAGALAQTDGEADGRPALPLPEEFGPPADQPGQDQAFDEGIYPEAGRTPLAQRGRAMRGELTRIPSEAGGDTGIAVRVLPPARPRYRSGAPIVVIVPGGHEAGNASTRGEYAACGFIEVAFAFPGGGDPRPRGGVAGEDRRRGCDGAGSNRCGCGHRSGGP